MATVTFSMKDPQTNVKVKKETYIRMSFLYGTKKIFLSTSLRIHPKLWNQDDQCVRARKDQVDFQNINNSLKSFKNKILKAYNEHLVEYGTLYEDVLKSAFREVLRPSGTKLSAKRSFLDGAREYHETCKKKPWTKKHYMTAINILERYEESIGKKLHYEDINMDFYKDFVDWMEHKERNKVMSYTLNTIGSHIKEIKQFMNAAMDNGWTNCTGHLHRKFKTMDETAESVYLDTNEIDQIYKLKLKNTTLDQVRDLFIIGCWTGLRYSDLAQISPDKFIKNGTQLKVNTEKTGETVIIPLHPHVKEILSKRDGHPPKSYADQVMNRNLKIVAFLAKLKTKVSKTMTRGGVRITKSHFTWELVTVHTGRRSFATNAFKAGMPTLNIMKLTGHKTERSFMKYIKISQEENASLVQDHSFFQLKVVDK